jgi:hypothetical protein
MAGRIMAWRTQDSATTAGDPASRPGGNAAPAGHAAAARGVLYPQPYLWYLFLSAMDVVFTTLILAAGGRELNMVAEWVLHRYGIRGMILLKFLMLTVVVLVCEFVGRHNHATGLKLSRWAVAASAFPVLVGASCLFELIAELRET